jgi:hypothetical protein
VLVHLCVALLESKQDGNTRVRVGSTKHSCLLFKHSIPSQDVHDMAENKL